MLENNTGIHDWVCRKLPNTSQTVKGQLLVSDASVDFQKRLVPKPC